MFHDDDYALSPEEMEPRFRATRARIEAFEKKTLRRLVCYALLKDPQTRDAPAVLLAFGVFRGGYAD
jgi:hypothetical protein